MENENNPLSGLQYTKQNLKKQQFPDTTLCRSGTQLSTEHATFQNLSSSGAQTFSGPAHKICGQHDCDKKISKNKSEPVN